MSVAAWCVIVGLLLVSMLLIDSFLAKLPTSSAMIYLVIGFVIGPQVFALIAPDPIKFSMLLGMVAEGAVLISLFAMGLKLAVPIFDRRWLLAIKLAFPSMVVTVGLIAIAAHIGFGFSFGEAILLGGILAPTDPVLASSVQSGRANSDDSIRFGLAGEGALNDGAAFPFVLLGLGIIGFHPLGTGLWRWWTIDLVWAIAGGLLIGGALGMLIGRSVVYLRTRFLKAIGLNEFLTLGLIAISYGVAQLMHASGFLAVLAAGLALRRVKENPIKGTIALNVDTVYSHEVRTTHSHHASASMKESVEDFNLQLEKLAELTVVLLVGAMLPFANITPAIILFILFLFLIIRPFAIWLGLLGAAMPLSSKAIIGWLGIRGIGSIFYLMMALNKGIPTALSQQLISLTLLTVAASIFLHGLTVQTLMHWYDHRRN